MSMSSVHNPIYESTKNPSLTSPELDSFGHDGDLLQRLAKPPADQQSRQIGANLDTSADFANSWSIFQDSDSVSGFGECVGGSEATETASDDGDVQRVGGFSATVQRCRL